MKVFKIWIWIWILPSLLYPASPSFSAKKQQYRLSTAHQLNLFWDKRSIRKNNVSNPDGELVELDETQIRVVPDLNFFYKKGVSSAIKMRVLGTLVNNDDQAYLSELYYRTLFGQTNVLIGKYIQTVGSSYFDNPADLLLPNTESEVVQDKINDDFKTGNVMLKVSRRFGDFSIEGVLADYQGDTILEEKFYESQFVLKLSQDLFDGSADISLLLRGVTDGQNGIGAIFSSEIGDDTIVYFQTSASVHKYKIVPKQTSLDRPANPQQPVSLKNPIVQPAMYQFQFAPKQVYNSHVFGVQHTGATTWNIISEYFYHGAGFTDDEFKTLKQGLKSAQINQAYQDKQFEGKNGNPYSGFIKRNTTLLRKGNYRQDYFKTRIATGQIFQKFEFIPIMLYNFNDQSYIIQMNVEFPREDYTLAISSQNFEGAEYSEYGMSLFQNFYSIKLQFIF